MENYRLIDGDTHTVDCKICKGVFLTRIASDECPTCREIVNDLVDEFKSKE